jgi:hypothetical protein
MRGCPDCAEACGRAVRGRAGRSAGGGETGPEWDTDGNGRCRPCLSGLHRPYGPREAVLGSRREDARAGVPADVSRCYVDGEAGNLPYGICVVTARVVRDSGAPSGPTA